MFSKKSPQSERRSRSPQPVTRPNAVFSYHANRSIRESAQFRDAERQPESKPRFSKLMLRKRLTHIAVAGSALLLLLMTMQLSDKAKVESVGTKEGQLFLRDKKVYVQAAEDAFRPFLNRNKLTVNTAKLASDMKRQFPELHVVSVSLPLIGDRPTVYVQPAIPKVILVARNGLFVLDSNGRVMISGNQVAKLDDLGLPVVSDQSNIPVEVGSIALPRSTVQFIAEVVDQLQAKQLKAASMVLPAGTHELHLKISGEGYTVKFNLHGNAREEAGTFLAVKGRLESERKKPREYIDVRVENKAYYR